ncbi:hypothetical protein [Pedobacter frigidisoli]|uniref:hypothetical protein n=1 Tax=Pedobacter frigidisoli TaxID=2530455 RepID=UPI00292CE35D|nr:hypothetical protein [Pedobacter frigidisoli]
MRKNVLIIIAILIAFSLGFGFKSVMVSASTSPDDFKKVTGIGGIFFKSKDPKKMREWYSTNLGLNTNAYGAVFEWYQGANQQKKVFLNGAHFLSGPSILSPLQRIS